MKTAGRENPNRGVATPSNRAHGAEGQNRPCSTRWAAKQEKLQPLELCFFLTSPFRELIRRIVSVRLLARSEATMHPETLFNASGKLAMVGWALLVFA